MDAPVATAASGLPFAPGTLSGRSALVTGSTSGIGLGIAAAFAAQGANVMLNGFGESGEIARTKEAIAKQHGIKVSFSAADLSKPAGIEEMYAQAIRDFGKLDILVNNAGIQHTAPVTEFPPDRWDAIIAVNLSAAFHAIRIILPDMLSRDWGRIINIASAHGLVASAHKAAYVAAKHGLVGLTKVVALETATTSVTCNAICPGWVLTPLVERQIDEIAVRDGINMDAARATLLGEKQPSRQFATPIQIGALAVFLCTEAAAQIRGAALPIDGGWTAQ